MCEEGEDEGKCEAEKGDGREEGGRGGGGHQYLLDYLCRSA